MKQLPKFHETFIPILEVLSNRETIHYNQLRKLVRDRYYSDLPEELYKLITKGGDPLILNRIGWGKAYLKQAKFVEQPERALVRITEKGLAALKSGKLTQQMLKSDPDYLAHEKTREKDTVLESENSTPEDFIDQGINLIESQVKGELLDRLRTIDPYYFERIILILLKKMGYGEFVETSKSNDQGIDGIINQDTLGLEKIYIQAKRYNENQVREKDIRNFIGAMSGDTTRGVFVTTSTFHSLAVKKASDAHHKIVLLDGEGLVDLMYQFGVGVQIKNLYELKELDEDFFESN
jgi:restriction system protein